MLGGFLRKMEITLKSLDLGCGPEPRNPFLAEELFGVDINNFENSNIKIADLAVEPIPFPDNSFDYISGFDFLEHIPRILYFGSERKQPFIDIMSEAWRVLKPDGQTFFATPAFPFPETFQDPQHVNFMTHETIQYFAGYYLNLGKSYGFKGRFEILFHDFAHSPVQICEGSVYAPMSYHLIWWLRAKK